MKEYLELLTKATTLNERHFGQYSTISTSPQFLMIELYRTKNKSTPGM